MAALVLGVSAVLAGCGATSAPSPVSAPSPTPTPPPTPVLMPATGTLEHAVGATDVVLRVGLEGGFVRMDSLMGRRPLFTLYGDGRILLVPADAVESPLTRGPAGVIAWPALRDVRLTEAEMQDILAYALADGGLGIAQAEYGGTSTDVPATVFEIHAGGVDRTVTVSGLTPDPAPGPDAAAMRAFSLLLGKLRAIASVGDYVPGAWMAVIGETGADPANPGRPWPWTGLAPAAFAQPADADPVPFPRHLLTTAQVALLRIDAGAGGVSGLRLAGEDGRTYAVAIRPALPEETASR